MIEIYLQRTPEGIKPFSVEDAEKFKEYRMYQPLHAKITGVQKERSYKQLKMYWTGCHLVSDNTDDPTLNTKEKVDFSIRVALHFVDPTFTAVRPDGTVQFKYRSISYKELKHIDANSYFDRAFAWMSDFLGTDLKTFMERCYETT